MPTAPKRAHRAALTRMLRHTGLSRMPDEAPLVELLRMLADELDNGGGSRARAEYLSALKDARRVLNGASSRPRAAESKTTKQDAVAPADEADDTPPPSNLLKFKNERGIA
jgi:hypothetical protein